ncbi:MAG: efflux RND transporter periplasmic adaptor subunit [Candidatus Latescibacterota bacterium]
MIHHTQAPAKALGVFLFALSMCLVTVGCGGGDEAQAPPQQHAQRPGGSDGKPQGERPDQPPIPVAVDEAVTGAISSYYTATAALEAEKEAEILARVTGIVEALECEEGNQVKEGSVLLRIVNDEYRLRLSQAEASMANLKDRAERLKGMWERNLVSAEEFEIVQNDLKVAEAAAGLARLDLSYTRVKAPFSGRVVQRLVNVGQNVSAGTPLFVLSDFDPLLARVYVPSKEFKKLKPDQAVELILDSDQTHLQGRITLVSPIIDPSTGTIKVTVEISNYPTGTRPGDFTEVRIVTEKRTGSILVPKIAVFTDRGDLIAYVAANGTAERRVVEVGFQDDVNAEILSGLSAGESVITKGQRSLKHGAPIKIIEGQPAQAGRPDQAGF